MLSFAGPLDLESSNLAEFSQKEIAKKPAVG